MTKLNDKISTQNTHTTVGTTCAAAAGLGCFVGYGAYYGVLSAAAATGTTTVMGPAMLAGGVMIALAVNQTLKADMLITEINKALEETEVDFRKLQAEQKDQEVSRYAQQFQRAFNVVNERRARLQR